MNNLTYIKGRNLKYDIIDDSKSFPILSGVDIEIKSLEIIGILGPNGCGKSTLLRILTRLAMPTSGDVIYRDRLITIGMIFQDVRQNLIPWRTVLDNVGLPSFLRKGHYGDTIANAKETLRVMGLSDLLERFPHELSGGQQQLVNLARWFANPTDVLFVDEGWSMLDLVQRQHAYDILKKMVVEYQSAICLVSHNVTELACVSDRVIIMTERPSKIAQEVDLSKVESLTERSEILWEASQSVFNMLLKA